MRRLKKTLKFSLWGIAILTVIAVFAYFLALPAIAKSQVNRVLAQIGVRQSRYELQRVSLFRLQLQRVELGQPSWFNADQIAITYTPWSLWSGRVRDLTMTNLVWRIVVRDDGRIAFGPQSTPSTGTAQPFDLALDSLSLRDATIALERNGRRDLVQVFGSVVRDNAGVFTTDLSLTSANPLAVEQARLVAQDVSARLRSRLEFTTEELRVFALNGTEISARQVLAAATSADWQIAPLRIGIDESTVNPALRIELRADATPVIQTTLRVEQAPFASQAAKLAFSGVSGTIPIAVNAAPPQQNGQFQIRKIQWRGAELPALSGTMAIRDQTISASLDWPLLPNAMLSAHGSADFAESGLTGEVTAKIPPFELSDSTTLNQIVPQLAHADLGGTYALDATIAIKLNQLKPLVKLTAKHASVATAGQSVSISDADASVTINNFSPLSTPVSQWVRVHRGQLGQLPVNDGIVYFVLENQNSLAVQEADFDLGKFGKFKAQPFRFDPLNAVLKTNIACSDVGLDVWLPLLSNQRATGTGQLTGDLQVTVRPGAANVFELGNGYLQAQNPPGTIQTSDASTISQYLESANVGGGDQTISETRARVVRALTDFRYDVLHISLLPEQGSTTAKVQIQGVGRTGAEPVPIGGITLNVENFDVLLRTILNLKSRL